MAFLESSQMFNRLAQKPTTLLEMVEANRLKNQRNQQNEMALRKQKQSFDFDEQNNPLKLVKSQFENMSEQDKFIEQELLQGSIELQPLLDAKNSQGIVQSLQMRRNKLAQAGLRTDEIDNAIQLAQQGDFDTLKQLTSSQIQAGRMIGLIDDNRQNLPAGIQYADELAKARASGDKQRVRDILTMTKAERLPTGVTYNQDGSVSNIGGLEDAIGGQEGAKKYAGSQAILPAEQEKQDMRVDAEKKINADRESIKSHYEKARIKNINNAKLTLQERQAEDIRLQRERDKELELDAYTKKATINVSKKEKEEQNKIIIEAQAAYPKIEQQAEETLNLIDRVINNPSLYDAQGNIQSKLPTVFQDTEDYQLLKDQLSNQIFVNVFQDLKGAGHITDIEGLKSTLAKFQSSLSGSPALLIQSAKNLQKQIIKSTKNAKNLAEGKVFYKTQTTQQPQQSSQDNDPLGLFQ